MLPWPHTMTVEEPIYSKDAEQGTVTTWNSVATGVLAQIDPSGGSVTDRFGGDGLTDRATVMTPSSVVQNGYRLTLYDMNGTSLGRFRVMGQTATYAVPSTIPEFYTWQCEQWSPT